MMLKISRTMSGARPERRLIQHQELRPAHQRASHCEHLPLAAGERSRELIAPLREPREPLIHIWPASPSSCGLRRARPLKRAELEIVGDAHRGEKLAPLRNEDEAARDALLDRQRRR